MRPNGVILYRGPSLINGKPIVCVATGLTAKSKNEKTGEMVQVYILSDEDERPTDAVKSGKDASICGDCPARGKWCYVNIGRVNQVSYAVARGTYPMFDYALHAELFRNRLIRFGSYGDPAAVPTAVWSMLSELADGHTGYTHQWRNPAVRLQRFVMASCETEADVVLAKSLGYRTFRVRLASQPVRADEIICPASAEAGKRRTCETCKACHGAGSGRNVVIIAHGSPFANHYKERMYAEHVSKRLSLELV